MEEYREQFYLRTGLGDGVAAQVSSFKASKRLAPIGARTLVRTDHCHCHKFIDKNILFHKNVKFFL